MTDGKTGPMSEAMPGWDRAADWDQRYSDEYTSPTCKILSIDAWRDGDGWTWNDLRKVGSVPLTVVETLTTPRKVLAYLRAENFLSEASRGRCRVEMDAGGDGVLIEVQDRRTGEPLFAISNIHGS